MTMIYRLPTAEISKKFRISAGFSSSNIPKAPWISLLLVCLCSLIWIIEFRSTLGVKFPSCSPWRSPGPWLPLFSATPQGWETRGLGYALGYRVVQLFWRNAQNNSSVPKIAYMPKEDDCSSVRLTQGYSPAEKLWCLHQCFPKFTLGTRMAEGGAAEASVPTVPEWAHNLQLGNEILLSHLWRLTSCSLNTCQWSQNSDMSLEIGGLRWKMDFFQWQKCYCW